MRTITIEIDEQGFTVREGDRYHDGLCWDEMLGQVTELTHPKLGETRYPMLTETQWTEWRKRLDRPKNHPTTHHNQDQEM